MENKACLFADETKTPRQFRQLQNLVQEGRLIYEKDEKEKKVKMFDPTGNKHDQLWVGSRRPYR